MSGERVTLGGREGLCLGALTASGASSLSPSVPETATFGAHSGGAREGQVSGGSPAPSFLRQYALSEVGEDGYPPEWHAEIKHLIRSEAGHRCVRCGHPYKNGEHGNGNWSPCDDACRHGGPVRWSNGSSWQEYDGPDETIAKYVEAAWRILTVHHLDGDKANCRWWNLASLCQRCHLTIQGHVHLHRVWPWEHSEWFKPYAAGWYAHAYLGEELSRTETEARLDELLALERIA